MALSAAIGEFLQTVKFADIPEEAVGLARDAFTDTVGVIMAGVDEPVVGVLRCELSAKHAGEEARACLSPMQVWAPDAALIGGTAAHAHDFDDQSLTGHPSAVLVPAILAEGEALGSSGRELVTAYVAGYEVWAELVRRGTGYHRKGWHPTSVFGVVGAAAACSVLRRLSAGKAVAALSIAASHASGLAVNFGTMTKPYHAGLASQNGVIAARMADYGMSAANDTFEHREGFLTAFAPDAMADWDSPASLGKEWRLVSQRLCVKRYPTCYFMHRSFDATTKLLAEHHVGSDEIAGVDVTMGMGQTAVLVNERPQTGLQAKFSEQFAMAAAAVIGRMGLEELSDVVVQRPDIQAFFPKVSLTGVNEFDPRDPAHSPSERVLVRLHDGRVLDTGPITTVRGHAYDPLSTEEMWGKFRDCTVKTHSEQDASELFAACQSIEGLRSTRDVPTARNVFSQPTASAARHRAPAIEPTSA